MSEIVREKNTGIATVRGRRPAPKVRPKNKEDNKMVSNNNELIEGYNDDIKESVDLDSLNHQKVKLEVSLLAKLERCQ